MQTTASWTLTPGSAGGSPRPTPTETTGGRPSRGQAGGPGRGSHRLLSSSLPSGLLYLNDDFQGGHLFFTEPNALTVTVNGGQGGGQEAQLWAQDSKQKVPRGKCREVAGAALALSFPGLPSASHHLCVQGLS